MTDRLHERVNQALKASQARFAVPWLVRQLEKKGFETWAVGGSVRDAIRGQPDPAADWDFATAARPKQVQEAFVRTVPVGLDHGTVGVLKSRRMYEVTTFRRDVETTGRHAVVQFASTLDEDLARRDFTINAIAWHPINAELRDPFNGIGDIEAKVLRAVGDASARFKEDYLRILRGLRFAGRMDLTVEDDTWEAMVASVEGLATLSWERVREELMKVMASTPLASKTLRLYADSGALKSILMELESTLEDDEEWNLTLAMVDGIGVHDPILRVAALLTPVARRYGVGTVLTTLKRLRFSNAECDRIAGCVAPPFELPSASAGAEAARRWAAATKPSHRSSRLRLAAAEARARSGAVGANTDDIVCAIRAIRRVIHAHDPLSIQELAVDGRDLIRLGLKPGPAIGEVLASLLDLVLVQPELNDPDILLEHAQELMKGRGS